MRILPTRRLVQVGAALALAATVAVPLRFFVVPLIVGIAMVLVLAIADFTFARREVAPSLTRIIPERIVRGRATTILYKLSRPNGDATLVSILDELPNEMGGDVVIDDVPLRPGESVELARERIPLRRGIHPLGKTWILWRSPRGLFCIRAEIVSGGNVAVLPPSS